MKSTESDAKDVDSVRLLVRRPFLRLGRKSIVRGTFMSFGARMDSARGALFVERSALMSPFGYGRVKIDWKMGRQGDREIRSLEKIRAQMER